MAFGVGSFLDGCPKQGDGVGVEFVGRVGFVAFETGCELVGVLEDLVYCAGHGHHLRYFSGAGMAWMITMARSPSTYPTSRMRAAPVRADHHGEPVAELPDPERVAVGVQDVLAAQAVLER